MAANKTKGAAGAPGAAPAAPPEAVLHLYGAQWRLLHDGVAYQPGDTLELADADAQPLLQQGAVAPADAAQD